MNRVVAIQADSPGFELAKNPVVANSRFGVDALRRLLQKQGVMDKPKWVIHLAGTNGKGSTAAYAAALLATAGYQVGLFTSPHILSPTERFRLLTRHQAVQTRWLNAGAVEVPKTLAIAPDWCDEVCMAQAFYERSYAHWSSLGKDYATRHGLGEITPFECWTAMAYDWFSTQVDVLVVETGLGGALDATNAIDWPKIAVITSIGLDHQQLLGNTLEEIAQTKFRIVNSQTRAVVLPDFSDKLWAVWQNQAHHAAVSIVDQTAINNWFPTTSDCQWPGWMQHNMTAALFAVEGFLKQACQDQLAQPTQSLLSQIHAALLPRFKWLGRLSKLFEQPNLYFDGAHNLPATRSLIEDLQRRWSMRRVHLVLGFMADKDWQEMLRIWLADQHALNWVTVHFVAEKKDRALSVEAMAEFIEKERVFLHNSVQNGYNKTRYVFHFDEAVCDVLCQLVQDVPANEMILMSGSLYLLESALKAVLSLKEHQRFELES